jgi:peptide/nickel transport system ATP-binding protein
METLTLKQDKKREVVLDIQDLKVNFHTYAGDVKALDGIDLQIRKGEIVGIVGESGAGKSVTALAITGLLPETAKIVHGKILLYGEDLAKMTSKEMQKIRAQKIAMIFQDPATFLNPVLTIGDQLIEVFMLNEDDMDRRMKIMGKGGPNQNRKKPKDIAMLLSIEELRRLGLPDPMRIVKEFPHELSGGMRQRAMIAMAVARRPDLLIADEITTALDVTIQAQILDLLKDLRKEIDASIIIITHDLGVVAEVADRVAVMYAGNIVEVAYLRELFKCCTHPYTKGLLKAVPVIGSGGTKLEPIAGSIPNLINPPSGCRYHPRCPYAFERCRLEKPELFEVSDDHFSACFLCSVDRS